MGGLYRAYRMAQRKNKTEDTAQEGAKAKVEKPKATKAKATKAKKPEPVETAKAE